MDMLGSAAVRVSFGEAEIALSRAYLSDGIRRGPRTGGDRFYHRHRATANQTHSGPYVGIGLYF